jgi:hypothetical protein
MIFGLRIAVSSTRHRDAFSEHVQNPGLNLSEIAGSWSFFERDDRIVMRNCL